MRPAALALLSVLTALPVAAAAPQSAEIARLQAEFRDERARARSLRAEAAEAGAEIAALERDLARLRSQVRSEDSRIAAQRARLQELGLREAALAARLTRTRSRQARLLSALQTLSRSPPPPLLVPADQAVDTVRASILMRAVAPELQSRARALGEEQAELTRIRRLAALNSEQLFTTESARGDRRAEIERLTTRKTVLQAVLSAEAREAERTAAALEARLRALGAAVPSPDLETQMAAARLPAGRSTLTSPVAGPPSAKSANGWRWRGDGLEARAPASARVAWTGPLSGWDQVVILDLGPGWRAVIAGLEEVSVESGSRVADGQTLGRTGPDGELSFELRREERPVDPAPWLR